MLIYYARECDKGIHCNCLNLKWKRTLEYLQFGEITSLAPLCNIFLKFVDIIRVFYRTWQRIPKFWTRVLEGSKSIRISMKLRLMETTLVSKIVIWQWRSKKSFRYVGLKNSQAISRTLTNCIVGTYQRTYPYIWLKYSLYVKQQGPFSLTCMGCLQSKHGLITTCPVKWGIKSLIHGCTVGVSNL